MATETELERMLIRLVGDASEYMKMLKDARRVTNDAAREISRAGERIENINQSLQRAGRGISSFGSKMAGVGAIISLSVTGPLTLFAKSAFSASMEMAGLERGLTAVAGGSEEARKQLATLREVAKLPGLGLQEAIQGSIRLQAVKVNADLANRALGAFGNALVTVGKGRAELAGVILAITQIAAKGKVQSEEINQIAERMPQIREALKQAFGTADTEKLQKQGLQVEQFLVGIIEELEKLPTVGGGVANTIENLGDSFFQLKVEIGNVIGEFVSPVLNKASILVVNLTNKWKSLSPEMKKLIVIIGGVTAVIGPLLTLIGTGTIFFGAFIASLGSIVAAIGSIVSTVGAIAGTIMGALAAVKGAVIAVIGVLGLKLAAITAAIAGIVVGFGSLVGVFPSVREGFRSLVTAAKRGFKSMIEGAFKFVKMTIGFFQNFSKNIREIYVFLVDNWGNVLSDMIQLVIVFFKNLGRNALVGFETVVRLFAVQVGHLTTVLELVGKFFVNMWNKWSKFMTEVWSKVFTQEFVDKAIEALVNVLRKVIEWAAVVGGIIAGAMDPTGRSQIAAGKAAFQFLDEYAKSFNENKKSLSELVGEFGKTIVSDFNAGMADLNPLDAMNKVLKEQGGKTKGMLDGFVSSIEKFPDLDFTVRGIELPQFLKDLFADPAEEAVKELDKVGGAANKAAEGVKGIFQPFRAVGKESAEFLTLLQKASSFTGGAREASKRLAELPDAFEGLGDRDPFEDLYGLPGERRGKRALAAHRTELARARRMELEEGVTGVVAPGIAGIAASTLREGGSAEGLLKMINDSIVRLIEVEQSKEEVVLQPLNLNTASTS